MRASVRVCVCVCESKLDFKVKPTLTNIYRVFIAKQLQQLQNLKKNPRKKRAKIRRFSASFVVAAVFLLFYTHLILNLICSYKFRAEGEVLLLLRQATIFRSTSQPQRGKHQAADEARKALRMLGITAEWVPSNYIVIYVTLYVYLINI